MPSETHAVQYAYMQQPTVPVLARPEKRDGAWAWFLAGLFIWPLLFVALKVYSDDSRAYSLAMAEYQQGINSEWYWQGLKRPPHGQLDEQTTKQSTGVLKAVVLFIVISAVLVVGGGLALMHFSGTGGGSDTGGRVTIEELGG